MTVATKPQYRSTDPGHPEFITDSDLGDEFVRFIRRQRQYVASLRRIGAITCSEAIPLWTVEDVALGDALSIRLAKVRTIRKGLRAAGRLSPTIVKVHEQPVVVDGVPGTRISVPGCRCADMKLSATCANVQLSGVPRESQAS